MTLFAGASHAAKPKRRRWSPEDDELLNDLYGTVAVERIAARLGRTVTSVFVRAGQQRLGRRMPAGSLTGNETMLALGCTSPATFRRWIRDGLLEARQIPAYGRADRPVWCVEEPALIAFLRDHGHQVDRDGVDLAYRQFVPERWVSLVDAFKAGAAFPNHLEAAVKAGLIPEARKRGDLGTKWVVPVRIVPALVEARRRMTSDADHRRLLGMYHRSQVTGNVKRRKYHMQHRAALMADGGRKERVA